MDAVEPGRNWDAADATDTSESLPGKRNRATDDAADKSDESPDNQEKRCRVGNLHSRRSSREDGVEMSFTENSPSPPPTSSCYAPVSVSPYPLCSFVWVGLSFQFGS